MKSLLRIFGLCVVMLWTGLPLRAQYGELPPLHVDGRYLKDPHGNVVNLHGVMDTPNPYFNNYRWGNSCEMADVRACQNYFEKLFTALTDTTQGAWCNIFRLHLDPCWTNDPNKPSTGEETGEANISRYSRTRLNSFLRMLFVPLAEQAMDHGMYVVMRPPGVCPQVIQVGGEYQEYLLDVWGIVSSNALVKQYSGQISLELANEPITCLDAEGNETPEALHDFFQPIVDKIRANGFNGILWIPGSGYQSNYVDYVHYPIESYNIGYAVHAYVGWYNCDDETATPERFIEEFGKSVPVVQTNPVLVSEVDWSPEMPGEGHYNEHGDWVPGNMGTWATGTTSGWGNSFKAALDHYGNMSMTLTGTADYIDIDTYLNSREVVPAFGGEPEACAQACFDWYADYAKVDYPHPEFTCRYTADQGDGTFVNPLLAGDFPAPDVIRVEDTYYLASAATVGFPGVTLLQSNDLVNWTYCAQPLQSLYASAETGLADELAPYADGHCSVSLGYGNGRFYLYFAASATGEEADGRSYLLMAERPDGPWQVQPLDDFYGDAGLFSDGEELYLAHGRGALSITRLDSDFRAAETEQVVAAADGTGNCRLYRTDDYYYLYVAVDGSAEGQTVYRSTQLFGPYEAHEGNVFEGQQMRKGCLVQTQTGEWWTVLAKEHGTAGHLPYLEPVTWTDGWPVIGNDGTDVSRDGATYGKPDVGMVWPMTALTTNETFTGTSMGLQWQWNRGPEAGNGSIFERPGYLRLHAGKAGDGDLRQASALLTQRLFVYDTEGTAADSYRDSYATACFDLSGLQEGDVCGLCVMQEPYAYIGVKMENGQHRLVYYRSAYDENGTTVPAVETYGEEVSGKEICLRAVVNFGTDRVTFHYSTDNSTYQAFGEEWTMRGTAEETTGSRVGLFACAAGDAGGYADIDWFTTETEFSERKYYAEGTLQTYTEDDLSLASLTAADETLNLKIGDRQALVLTATFRSGRTENVAASCRYECSPQGAVEIRDGYIQAVADGDVEITAYYTDYSGQTLSTTLHAAVATFPLTAEGFNPSIWETGSFNESTGCLITGPYGFGGWQYDAGLDLSAYNYLVVRLKQSASCQPSFRLFDNPSYWTDPYMFDMGTGTEARIDLQNMKKADGTKCDPSHIYIAGLWTMGGSPVYIKEVFLSNDGENPVGVEAVDADADAEVVSVVYYSLSGQMFSAPQPGVNVVKRVLSDGRVEVKKVLYP